MRRILTLFITIVLAQMPAMAQINTTSFSGRVMDGDDPVEGATVIAINNQTGFQYSAETDAKGYYYLIDIAIGGPYTIRFVSYGSKSVTLRGVTSYVSENLVIDVNLADGSSYVHKDTAASVGFFGSPNLEGSTMSVGQPLTSKAAMIPQNTEYDVFGFWPEPTNQISFTQTPYDVRQSGNLLSSTTSLAAKYGSNALHGLVYDYYTNASMNDVGLSNMTGFSVSAPLFSDDLLAYAALDYRNKSLSGYGRMDWRANDNTFFDVTVVGTGSFSLLSGEMVNRLSDGRASNDLNALYYKGAGGLAYGSLTD